MKPWYRVCVDIDHQGHPVGWSWERHYEGEVTRITTGTPGPFDAPADVFLDTLAQVPLQLALWPS